MGNICFSLSDFEEEYVDVYPCIRVSVYESLEEDRDKHIVNKYIKKVQKE
jgi:hypothetical protein